MRINFSRRDLATILRALETIEGVDVSVAARKIGQALQKQKETSPYKPKGEAKRRSQELNEIINCFNEAAVELRHKRRMKVMKGGWIQIAKGDVAIGIRKMEALHLLKKINKLIAKKERREDARTQPTLDAAACMVHVDDRAPVAQMDRALPPEGRGHRFESCRVRQMKSRKT